VKVFILFKAQATMKIAIIKADDIREATPRWHDFFKLLAQRGIPCSAGVICDSLQQNNQPYQQWLLDLHHSGLVEFWNHGWNHSRWLDERNQYIHEFSGNAYPIQKKHFMNAQSAMANLFGSPPIVFGAPFNAIDDETVRVIDECPDTQFVFGYSDQRVFKRKKTLLMSLRGEHNGVGKPDFEKFKQDYYHQSDIQFSALQFHPNKFENSDLAEASDILDFLVENGWQFVLPRHLTNLK
jgi:peptidoglycan/xylan/chitin deacetylase (PgdA/CDA1 family)